MTKCKLDELSEYQSYLDTGLNTEEAMSVFAKMYKDIDDCLFDYILLRKISPQQELFR